MSRSKRGEKGGGYEYWSRRPGNKSGGVIGSEAKAITHGIERAQEKRIIADGLEDAEYTMDEKVSTVNR